MKKQILCICLVFGFFAPCQAQNKVVPDYNILPTLHFGMDIGISSPQVWSFMKYGGNTPNLYTGTVSASIPVYTYRDDDFTVPVSLNYASNGYMPNVQANDVGLGWFLNTGGCITRIIRGMPDNYFDDNVKGYALYTMDDFANTNIDLNESGYDSATGAYVFNYNNERIETESDIYMFNFMGHTGSFMFAGKKIYVFGTADPHGEYSIEMDIYGSSIIITTGDGYRYKFTVRDSETGGNMFGYTLTKTITAGMEVAFSPVNHGRQCPNIWMLSQITAPNGRTVSFQYNASDFSESIRFGGCREQRQVFDPNSNDYVWAYTQALYTFIHRQKTAQIQSITVDNGVKIDFLYSERVLEDYFYKEPKEAAGQMTTLKKLDVIKITNQDAKLLKQCDLNYTYADADYKSSNHVMFLSSVTVSGEGVYRMEYQHGRLPAHGTNGLDHWGYYNNDEALRSEKWFLPSFDMTPINFAERTPQAASDPRRPRFAMAVRGMLTKMVYPTGGYSTFEYEPHEYSDYITRDVASGNRISFRSGNTNKEAGGVRIHKITDYTADNEAACRTYIYGTKFKSSGILAHPPFYHFEKFVYDRKNGRLTLDQRLFSVADISSYHIDKSHIEYSDVTEKHDDGASVVYKFASYRDCPDLYQGRNATLQDPNSYVSNAELTNGFLMEPDFSPQFRGTLLAVSHYDTSNNILKEIKNSYDLLKTRKFVESVKFAADYFYIQRSYLESFPLIKTTVTDYLDPINPIKTETLYEYNTLGQISCVKRTGSDGAISSGYTSYVSDIIPSKRTAVQNTMMTVNCLNMPISTKTTLCRNQAMERTVAADKYTYDVVAGASGANSIRLKLHESVKTEKGETNSSNLNYYVANSYDAYNSMGRLLQKTDRNGLVTSYIWGYGGLYPVAEVRGVKHSVLLGISGAGIVQANALPAMQNGFIRNLSGALVTTYEYSPHIGVTKITDPAGRVTKFTYNANGKLLGEYDEKDNPIHTYIYSTDKN